MSARCLLVRDSLDASIRSIAVALDEAGIEHDVVSYKQLATARPADVVLLRIDPLDPVSVIWGLHRQGHSTILALSAFPSTPECIRLLNSGADFYLDAWAPLGEVVARVRVALRQTARVRTGTAETGDRHLPAASPAYHGYS
jgi:two-component system, OmpR family, KDP operon response regulator KdpE